MRLKWIDFDNATFRIPNEEAKNNKTEIVSIPPFLIAEMKTLQLHLFTDKTLYVFGKFGRPGVEPLGKNTMRDRFNRFREALGISEEYKFYSWKHTGAIALLQNGAKPYDIKNHLRHASFATTEVYLKKQGGNSNSSISTFASEI
jgi:integrase